MGDVLLVTGPAGAGKSTVAALLADRHTPSALVPLDDLQSWLRRGTVQPWLPGAVAQNAAVAEAGAAAAGHLARWGSVVVDGLVRPEFLDRFAAASGLPAGCRSGPATASATPPPRRSSMPGSRPGSWLSATSSTTHRTTPSRSRTS